MILNQSRLIVAVDFNGVIHDHREKVQCDLNSREIPGAIEWLKSTSEKYDVYVISASFAKDEFVVSAKRWLVSKGIPRSWMAPVLLGKARTDQRIMLTPWKPPCLMFIDDRGFCFKGTFPSIGEIEAFKPWNR